MTDTKVISMNIKPEAAKKIKSHVKDGQIVLLALNDGSNKYSKQGGTCTIGANFQFVILDKKDPEYNIKIDNNAGLDLYTSNSEMSFLDNGLVINAKDSTLSLSDDSGVVDGGVTISNFKPSKITKKDMIEGKTC
ncbi:iron-sulfur cluster biosynthesis family protein [Lactobacillus acetotolerans]|uniref:iron-sulfur cluster biosynthesis family protein n=1 Tax=Lactobacillus acetotolerans TaxID=1600 RepID=UPI0019D0A20D|nr:iron-sulfur cluster biosynthesis family protein [Lactobacillus acetotolerans]MBN7275832.1 iron-sulfur cluster biosynthesis family protein [Lactobacillus acetotolerans]